MSKTKLVLHTVTNQQQLDDLCNCPEMLQIRKLCKDLSDPSVKSGNLPGFCIVCDKHVKFSYDWLYSDEKSINFRERLICPICGLNNRQRAMLGVLLQCELPANDDCTSRIYLNEYVTPFYRIAAKRLSADFEVIGSEFLGFDIPPGTVVNNIRHEDASNMSFADNSLDAIVSNDVFEHVQDIETAFSEAYRTLKTGGKLIFSVPFTFTDKTKKRAQIVDGELVHLEEPAYHGNPVSSDGALVFYDFGWDMLDVCKDAGFSNVYMAAYFSEYLGNLCEFPLFVFIAEKNLKKLGATCNA